MLIGRQGRVAWLAAALVFACAPTLPPPKPAPKWVPSPPRARAGCTTAACWQKNAAAAREAGNDDVATVFLGRAYALEPNDEHLKAWIDALEQSGQHREAHRVLDRVERAGGAGARLVKELRAALGPAGADASAVPPIPSAPLRAAYQAEAEGGDAAAAFEAALAGSAEPAHLAHYGDLLWKAGDKLKARRAWARARILLDERGAQQELVPVEHNLVDGAFWIGGDFALVRRVAPIGGGTPAEEVEMWSPAHLEAPRRRLLWQGSGSWFSTGTELYRAVGARVARVDPLTGLPVADYTASLESVGLVAAGPSLHTLVAGGTGAELHDPSGALVASFALEGTTPTITRVYRGPGSYHDNILEDSPTWPVSLALSDDARFIAIGGSDSKVRLFDMQKHAGVGAITAPERILEVPWVAVDHRMMGANPDLNQPLAMRFVDGGAKLVVVFGRGDVVTWSTADGSKIHHITGTCSMEEATKDANRYAQPGEPPRSPTAEEREDCGRATVAILSADGTRAVTGGAGLRVRQTADGKGLLFMIELGDAYDAIALSPSGTLGLSTLYGTAYLWRDGAALKRFLPGSEKRSSPIDPSLTPDGRFLRFHHILAHEDVVLDLKDKQRLRAREGESLLAVTADLAVIATKVGVELRPRSGAGGALDKPAQASWGVGRLYEADAELSLSGTHLLVNAPGEKKRLVLVRDLARGRDVTFDLPDDARWLRLAPNGKALASIGDDTVIWDTDTGAKLVSLGPGVGDLTFSPDASFVVWLNRQEEGKRVTIARLRRLDSTDVLQLEVEGWSKQALVSPKGTDVLVITEDSITRWRPFSDESYEYPLEYHGANRIRYSTSGDQLFFEGYGQVTIRKNDSELSVVGRIVPFLDGQWAVMNASGAVDGSASAPDHMITKVTAAGEVQLLSARSLYDRLRVPGLLRQVLAGADVTPPKPGSVLPDPEKRILEARVR